MKGIGKKGAEGLVKEFASLQDLYENLDKVRTDRLRSTLQDGKDKALLSYKLFGLEAEKLDLKKSDLKFDANNWINAAPVFNKLEFNILLNNLEKTFGEGEVEQLLGKKKPKRKEAQEIIKFGAETKTTKDDWVCKVVETQEDLKDLISKIKQEKEFAFDTETEGLRPLQDGLLAISIAFSKKKSYYLPFVFQNSGKEKNANIFDVPSDSRPVLDKVQALKLLKTVFEDSRIKKIAHNAKFDVLSLVNDGINVVGVEFDTLVAANLLREGDWQKINLKFLSKYYLD